MRINLDLNKTIILLLPLLTLLNECGCLQLQKLYRNWQQNIHEKDALSDKQLNQCWWQLLMPVREALSNENIYLLRMAVKGYTKEKTSPIQKTKEDSQQQQQQQHYHLKYPGEIIEKMNYMFEKPLYWHANRNMAMSKYNTHNTKNRYKYKQKKRISYSPVISSSSLMHLGKYFYDLSKNIQFNEKHQWKHGENKLLENLYAPDKSMPQLTGSHHIRLHFHEYKPSKKVLWLKSFNPYRQWSHISPRLDPKYILIGLG